MWQFQPQPPLPTKLIPIPNIPQHQDDDGLISNKSIRKRQEIKLRYVGRGGGIKTELFNIQSIAASLGFHVEFLMRIIGIDMCTMIRIRPDSYFINGRFTINDIEKVLETFIHDFVICHSCLKPNLLYNNITITDEEPINENLNNITNNITNNNCEFLLHCNECHCERIYDFSNRRFTSRLIALINKYPPMKPICN